MNKKELIEKICVQLEKDLETQKSAALATYQAATGEESKAENEYDTRGLEASYLAGAQAKRVGEIEEQLSLYRHIEIHEFSENTPIASTALVHLTDFNAKESKIFLLPKGGGLSVQWKGETIQVINPTSPLGEAVLGLKSGDGFLVETGQRSKEYEIISVV